MPLLKSYPAVEVGQGVTRRVIADSPELMVVEVAFGSGAEGPAHRHPHVQSTFVAAGRFRFNVAGESFEVGPGDAFVIPSNAMHGCRALEPGVLIDTFTPRRDDLL